MAFGRRFLFLPLAAAGAVLFFSGCVKPYEPPKEGEPAALVKLQYTYASIRPGTTLRVSMAVREGGPEGDFAPAFQQDHGRMRRGQASPEIPISAVRLRPQKGTVVSMRLGFWWTTQRWVTTTTRRGNQIITERRLVTDFHEVGCSSAMTFTPLKDHVYLMNFSNPNVNKDCALKGFEQVPAGEGKFRLTPVGKAWNREDEA